MLALLARKVRPTRALLAAVGLLVVGCAVNPMTPVPTATRTQRPVVVVQVQVVATQEPPTAGPTAELATGVPVTVEPTSEKRIVAVEVPVTQAPTAAVVQMLAAVAVPRTLSPVLRMAPLPMKPMPASRPCHTRDSASTEAPNELRAAIRKPQPGRSCARFAFPKRR